MAGRVGAGEEGRGGREGKEKRGNEAEAGGAGILNQVSFSIFLFSFRRPDKAVGRREVIGNNISAGVVMVAEY